MCSHEASLPHLVLRWQWENLCFHHITVVNPLHGNERVFMWKQEGWEKSSAASSFSHGKQRVLLNKHGGVYDGVCCCVCSGILGFSADRVRCSESGPASPHAEGVQRREDLSPRMEPTSRRVRGRSQDRWVISKCFIYQQNQFLRHLFLLSIIKQFD